MSVAVALVPAGIKLCGTAGLKKAVALATDRAADSGEHTWDMAQNDMHDCDSSKTLLKIQDTMSDDATCSESLDSVSPCSTHVSVAPTATLASDASAMHCAMAAAGCSPSCPPQPPSLEEMLADEQAGAQLRPRGEVVIGAAVSPGDRASAVDGMARAASRLSLPSDVLFLGVACLDRCLATGSPPSCGLQATALACLWVAAKYEHATPPCAAHFLTAAACDPACGASRAALINAEAWVLQVLGYRISAYPTTKAFLRVIFLRARSAGMCVDPTLYLCACYLAEVSLLEAKLSALPASQVAATSFACASLLLRGAPASGMLTTLTGYGLDAIRDAMTWLLAVHNVLYQGRCLPTVAMYEAARKYRHPEVGCVCLVPSITHRDDPRLRVVADW